VGREVTIFQIVHSRRSLPSRQAEFR
jgi:hypothetical protein